MGGLAPPEPFRALLLFLFGSCIGSFLNVCITRLPAGESILAPASHCRSCKAPLPFRANLPLISYLLLRARCALCGARIPVRYFLVELGVAVAALACYRRVGPGSRLGVHLAFICALVVAAVADLETGIIPDAVSVYGMAAGFALSWCAPALSIEEFPSPGDSLLGALCGGGVLWATAAGYRAVTGRDGLGGGDVKLLAMIGSFAGWERVPGILAVSALAGSVCGIGLACVRKDVSLRTPLPFAPFLCLGALLCLY